MSCIIRLGSIFDSIISVYQVLNKTIESKVSAYLCKILCYECTVHVGNHKKSGQV